MEEFDKKLLDMMTDNYVNVDELLEEFIKKAYKLGYKNGKKEKHE